ncbi:hypothetical protein Tco_0590508 [Tanacetum coccineum]
MHLIPKTKNEMTVVKTTKTICPMVIKNIEIDRMTHDWWLRWWKDDFEVELDLMVLEEHLKYHQEIEDEVVPKVDDVSLVDEVFEGAFGGDGDEDFVMGEGVVVSSSSWVKSTKSFLGRMMVSLIFLEGLEEEDWVEAMEVEV